MKLKRAGILTKLIVVILLVYAVSTLAGLHSKISDANAELARLQDTVDAQNAKNAELEYAVNNSDNPSVIEDIARERLGLVYPDEKIFRVDQ